MHSGGVFAARAVCGVRGATALVLVGDALYVGTAGGMLATYALRGGSAHLESEVRVAKRVVGQLAYLAATDQLAVLADGCVTLCARTAPAQRTAVPTRGARCMHIATWTEGGCAAAPRVAARRGMDVIAAERTRAPQVHVSLLAIGCRRQLVAYRWVDGRFLDTHAAALPHTPHAFGGVVDPPSVFIGFLGAYARLVVPPAASSTAPPPVDAVPTAAAERIDRAEWAVYAVPLRAPERAPLLARAHAEPLVASVGGAAVLVHEQEGVFVDAHGRRTGQVLAMPAAPDALVYSPPFLVCAAGGEAAVYARETLRLVQRITLADDGGAASGARPRVAVDGTRVGALIDTHVHVLERQPPAVQLDALVRAGEFDEARTLLDTLRDGEIADHREWRTRVHACVGVAHFAAGRFDAAIDTFLELGVNPVHVLALYPASVAGSLARPPDEWLAAFGVDTPQLPDTPDAGARAALDALARFLSEHRRVLGAQLEAAGLHDSADAPEEPAPTAPFVHAPAPPAAVGLARIVDTALFKTFLRTKPALIAPLCRVDNWCSAAHVRTLLEERAMFAELAALYRGKEMHAAALALLHEHHMPHEAVAYLQTLGARWLGLVLEHAHWVLRMDVLLGLQIFVADTGRVHELPREAVAADLEAFDRDVCRMYLERVAHLGGRTLHTRLGRLYLERAHECEQTLAFLRTADYDAAALLAAAPAHAPAIRATLLGRLGRHDEALRIYVHELHDHAAAAQHCEAHVHAAPHIFESLLRLYLADGDARAAQELAAQHAAHISASTALALMPREWRIADVAAFFVRAGRTRAAKAHAARVHASLLAARDAQLGDAVRALCARRVVVGEGRTCPRCERRLGSAVVAVIPATGETLHYFCAHRR